MNQNPLYFHLPCDIQNVMIRRNSFFDNYNTTAHSQGLYSAGVGLSLEENFFDHNGWLYQSNDTTKTAQGGATIFNHNTYFANSHDVVFKNNSILADDSHERFIFVDTTTAGVTLDSNSYYSPIDLGDYFRVDKTSMTPTEWEAFSSEENMSLDSMKWIDPKRSVETYMASLEMTSSQEAFIQKVRSLSIYDWDTRFTAPVLNKYIREGFMTAEEIAPVRELTTSSSPALIQFGVDGRVHNAQSVLQPKIVGDGSSCASLIER